MRRLETQCRLQHVAILHKTAGGKGSVRTSRSSYFITPNGMEDSSIERRIDCMRKQGQMLMGRFAPMFSQIEGIYLQKSHVCQVDSEIAP
jgi:hypothetical protein